MRSHDHLVRIDEEKRELVIYRVDETGKQTLYTRVPLPATKADLESFVRQLGENLILDSPVARKLISL